MNYHIEYAKYKYGFVTIVGWLVGDTAEEETRLQVQTRAGDPVTAEITRTAREDIRRLFFRRQEKDRYGFRVHFASLLDQETWLVLEAGACQAKCKVRPWVIRWTRTIPDNWKEKWKQKILQRIDKKEFPWRQAWDGAINQYDGRENPYRDAMEFQTSVPWEKRSFSAKPVGLSILVPVYQTNREHLLELLESVITQNYRTWELCIADGSPESILSACEAKSADPENQLERRIAEILHDHRVKYRHLEQNLGISGNTNAGLELVTGEYVVMVDHDDVLMPETLWIAAERIRENPEVDFLYSASDLTDQDHLYNYNPLYKPGWSPEMLYSANYITHLSVVRTSLLRELGGFRSEYDGAQDWDLFLRIGEATKKIRMIPDILYHWRAAAGSTAFDVEEKPYAREAQLRAVQDHLDRVGIPGRAGFADACATCIRVSFSDPLSAAGESSWRQRAEEQTGDDRQRAGEREVGDRQRAGERKAGDRQRAGEQTDDGRQRAGEQSCDDWQEKEVCIVTAPGVELSPEQRRELRAWANAPGIGIVGVRVRNQDGTIRSQGTLLRKSSRYILYADEKPGMADAMGHTDWYRNDLVPHPACYAIPAAVAEEIGMPDPKGGEAAMTEWFLKMKQAGYRSLITPFVEVFVEAS